MKYKIGIYGSAVIENKEILTKAQVLGKELSKYELILITGAGKGLPYHVASLAKMNNKKIEIWGYPPVLNLEGLKVYTSDDITVYDKIFYIPPDFPFRNKIESRRQYRNVISTSHCDAGIIISGRWGSLNEFTNLHEGGKVIGIFTGTGGIADILPTFYNTINKESHAKVIFSSNPKQLIQNILDELNKKNKTEGK